MPYKNQVSLRLLKFIEQDLQQRLVQLGVHPLFSRYYRIEFLFSLWNFLGQE